MILVALLACDVRSLFELSERTTHSACSCEMSAEWLDHFPLINTGVGRSLWLRHALWSYRMRGIDGQIENELLILIDISMRLQRSNRDFIFPIMSDFLFFAIIYERSCLSILTFLCSNKRFRFHSKSQSFASNARTTSWTYRQQRNTSFLSHKAFSIISEISEIPIYPGCPLCLWHPNKHSEHFGSGSKNSPE